MNNTKILEKCVEALSKDKPDISYIKGMLETLIELNPTQTYAKTVEKVAQPRADEETDIEKLYNGGPVGRLS